MNSDDRQPTALQIAALTAAIRELPAQLSATISKEVRAGVAEGLAHVGSDENIDRMVGVALAKLRDRAAATAATTLWGAIKSLANRWLAIVGLLALAYAVGGKAYMQAAIGWLMKP